MGVYGEECTPKDGAEGKKKEGAPNKNGTRRWVGSGWAVLSCFNSFSLYLLCLSPRLFSALSAADEQDSTPSPSQ